jgi:hypothetical protein
VPNPFEAIHELQLGEVIGNHLAAQEAAWLWIVDAGEQINLLTVDDKRTALAVEGMPAVGSAMLMWMAESALDFCAMLVIAGAVPMSKTLESYMSIGESTPLETAELCLQALCAGGGHPHALESDLQQWVSTRSPILLQLQAYEAAALEKLNVCSREMAQPAVTHQAHGDAALPDAQHG